MAPRPGAGASPGRVARGVARGHVVTFSTTCDTPRPHGAVAFLLLAIDGMNIHEIVLTTDFSRDDLIGEARRERIRGEARERKIDTERAGRRGAPV